MKTNLEIIKERLVTLEAALRIGTSKDKIKKLKELYSEMGMISLLNNMINKQIKDTKIEISLIEEM
jgi:hypothetical protein